MAISATQQIHGPATNAVTLRAMILAVVTVLVSVLWDEWNPYYMDGSNISRSHFPLAFLLPYLLLCVANVAVHRLIPGGGLSKPELVVILGTGLIAISVAYDGITGQTIGIIAGPFYFATAENRWSIFIHDHIPIWLVPSNDRGEMDLFYEGVPPGQSPMLDVWTTPLFWWTCLIAALAFAVFCLVVMLRKQWIQNERLSYPLVEVGDIFSETQSGGSLQTVLRSPVFWIGFGFVMSLKLWNIASYFTPAFPFISIEGQRFTAVPDFPVLITRVSFYAIGFGYFARLEVLLSVWFFILLTATEVFAFNKFGYSLGAAPSQWGSQALGYQSLGALLFLAAWSLWMARRHLRDVWARAVHSDITVDDSQELLSYRSAFVGFVGSIVFVAAWLYTAGMDLWVLVVFLPVSLLAYLGLARVVAELGLAYVYCPVQPTSLMVKVFGASVLGPASVTMLSLSKSFEGIGKGFLMPAFAQAVKAVDGVVRPRRITLVIWLALGLGYAISVVDTLYIGYNYGAYNLGNMGLKKAAPSAFNRAVSEILNPTPFGGNGRALWVGIGAIAMAILTLIRYRMPTWPLHPIGLALQGSYGLTKTWMSIFFAWFFKTTLISLGGSALYKRGKPFFIGLIVAQAVSTALVFVVDWFWFPAQGHNVHNY
ncbi:MAG TPA: hypothetical protein DHW45_08535 [Candidatus Latescibacteria bacterium]|jgi:hypothetical protein|nr:hypothetical protein [Candidatus Latescibacterota bacterium]